MRPIAILVVAALAVSFAPRRWRVPLWCLAIMYAVVPWSRFLDHAHWERVQWIPFVPPPDLRIRDLTVNVLMYVPFGWFMSRAGLGPIRLTGVVVAAMTLSALTELTQVFSHGRFPTSTDVLMNVSGALLGALLARRWRRGWRHTRRPRNERRPGV